jgi:hypothetical protein
VGALDLVELDGAGDAVQHRSGDAAGVPAFKPRAALDRDARPGAFVAAGADADRPSNGTPAHAA